MVRDRGQNAETDGVKMLKTRTILIVFSLLFAGMAVANLAPRPHVDQDLIDQRLPRQLVMVGDEGKIVWYNKDDAGDWWWWSLRASGSMVTDANYIWPWAGGDVNEALAIYSINGDEYALYWGGFGDANGLLPDKTPWNVMFVGADGYPLTEDPNNFTYYQPETAFGLGLDNIAEGTYANNYIQVYSLLDFEPNLFNVTIGRGSDDTATGPNNVTIGRGAGNVLDEGYENTLGGKDAGRYLIDSNDNTGWGYKVIGGAGDGIFIPATYKYTYISENGSIWGIPVTDRTLLCLDNGGAAVNVGGGVVGLPYTGNPFVTGERVIITGTTNYNGDFVLQSGTTSSQLNILDGYVAETFDGTETVAKIMGGRNGPGLAVMASDGTIYAGGDRGGTSWVSKITSDGTIDTTFFDGSEPNIPGSSFCTGLALSPDEQYLYVSIYVAYITDWRYVQKYDLTTGQRAWNWYYPTNVKAWPAYGPAMDCVDSDGNYYTAASSTVWRVSPDGNFTSLGTGSAGSYCLVLSNDLNVIISDISGSTSIVATSLDGPNTDTLFLGGVIAAHCVEVYDGYIYAVTTAGTLYKVSWDGSGLAVVDSVATGFENNGLYADLWGNIVVIRAAQSAGVLNYYDTDLNSLGAVEIYDSIAGLYYWNLGAAEFWHKGNAMFNGALAVGSEPDVHRVTAVGAYAAARVVEGADDGLYLGAFSGAHNTTDPNRFFLDNLDRTTLANEQTKGMMYGYFAADPNDQWLTINVGELNLPIGRFDVNDVNVAGTLTLQGQTASRLLATDGSKNVVSTDLVSWVAATADETTVADDGDGTITIGIADPLIVSKGGTGAATLTDHGILLGSGTDAVTPLGAATNGQIPIGSTGADPVLATLTGTANQVNVTNEAGTIALSTPQDIDPNADVSFNSVDVNSIDVSGNVTTAISDTQVVYSNSGVLAGHADLAWDDTNRILDANAVDVNDVAVLKPNSAVFQPAADSTTFFQVKDKDANVIATVDTVANTLIANGAVIDGTIATGLDMSGGTFATAVQNWPATPVINVAGTRAIKFDDVLFNLFMGNEAFILSDGLGNVGIGYQAGYNNDSTGAFGEGDDVIYIGYKSGYGVTPGVTNTGYINVGLGSYTLYSNTTGYGNMAIGGTALRENTTGSSCVAVGAAALHDNSTGYRNVGIGTESLFYNTTGYSDLGIGYAALYSNTDGFSNVAIGTLALYANVSGDENTAIGYYASSKSVGDYGICIGSASGSNVTSGAANTIIGTYGHFYNQTGTENTVIGFLADGFGAGGVASHSYSTVIGSRAGYGVTTGGLNVYLGYSAGKNQTTNSNLLIIDNQDRTSAALEITNSLIYGVFAAAPANQSLRINGEILGSDGAKIGDGGTTNYLQLGTNGDLSFVGTAGFYPRFLTQADEPAAGTGATQCDTSELVVWKDSDDSKVYVSFNDGGTVKSVELSL